MRARPARTVALGLVPLLALGATACDRGEPEPRDEAAVVAKTAEAELPAWLAPTDGSDPARWLAGREAGHPLAADAEPVRAMRDSVARARTGFIEDPRMIANRTVQLGQMLGEIGRAEGYRTLIDGFGEVAARRGRHKSLYGEMCQHYFNTRAAGADHADALAQLGRRVAPPAAEEAPR